MAIEAGRLVSGQVAELPPPDVNDADRWSRLPPLTEGIFSSGNDTRIGHQARQPRVLVNEKQDLLDEVGGPDWYLVSRVPCETGGWCRTILADDLVDSDGDVELLLAGRAAVLVRPDRYLFGSADDDSIGELVGAAKRLIGIATA